MVSISPEPLHTGTHFSPLLPQQAFSPRHHDPVSGTSFQFSLTPAHCEKSIASKCLGDCEQIQSIRHTTSVPAYADNEKNCDKTNTGFCVGNHKKVCIPPPFPPLSCALKFSVIRFHGEGHVEDSKVETALSALEQWQQAEDEQRERARVELTLEDMEALEVCADFSLLCMSRSFMSS